jgi:hypothetical protein
LSGAGAFASIRTRNLVGANSTACLLTFKSPDNVNSRRRRGRSSHNDSVKKGEDGDAEELHGDLRNGDSENKDVLVE